MTTPNLNTAWTFRADGLPPGANTSVYVLSDHELRDPEEREKFRREFAGIGPTFSEKRIRELYLGRKCAQLAIREKFGIEAGWMPIAESGMPELPRGVRASLTHSTIDGVPVAAVALASEPEFVGIDLEPILSLETALKLERRFGEHFRREERTPEAITELFTIYETVVKIASTLGRGKPVPSQIELIDPIHRAGKSEWSARLNGDRIDVLSGVFLPAFSPSHARLCVGWWNRDRSRS